MSDDINKKKPNIKAVIEHALKVSTTNPLVTTLDVKNSMRADGYWVDQEYVSETMNKVSKKEDWDWTFDCNPNHKLYSVKPIIKDGGQITRDQVKDWIETNIKTGHLFGVTFIKKDDTIRNMVCRFGVKKGIDADKDIDLTKPTRDEINEAHNQLTVFDVHKDSFKQVNLDTLKTIRYNKTVYEVV